ncbi:MAG: aldo/keto reductase [Chloroflexi bacterium]|nr:aldo/keto reductase [Chloroflexota bacterium]
MDEVLLGPTETCVPKIGLGTARYFGGRGVLVKGLAAGLRLIDTAESYNARGDEPGEAELLVGEELAGHWERVFIATKISPRNLRAWDVPVHARASARRLGVEVLDLYQIHGPNPSIPIGETIGALERLVDEGLIRFIGVSNFSADQLKAAQDAARRYPIVSNQIRYHLFDRGVADDVLEYCQETKVTVIAHTPLALADFDGHAGSGVLREVSQAAGRTPAQVMLNWLVSQDGVIAIPKTDRPERVAELAGSVGWELDGDQRRALDGCA